MIGATPIWASAFLPIVDLPQHLHLISVLHWLNDEATLYPSLFETREGLTPYLGYYYAAHALHFLLPLDIANKVFLSLYVMGMPLALAYLLASLRRPIWPALLAIPFAYGDSFAWGFVNYVAAIPLTFLACGLFVRTVSEPTRRSKHAIALALSVVAVLLFHVQAFLFLGLALPFLFVTTKARDQLDVGEPRSGLARWFRPRVPALVAMLPAVTLFAVWFGSRLGTPTEIAPGQPWRAWGPMLSRENLSFKTFEQNRIDLVEKLANMLRDGSDRYAVYAVAAVAGIGLLLALLPKTRGERHEGPVERCRILGLATIALALFFTMPFDIHGYMTT